MAVPKSKISKARKHARRANWKLTAPCFVVCPKCKAMMLAHHVCKNCGYYGGKQIIEVAKADEAKAEA